MLLKFRQVAVYLFFQVLTCVSHVSSTAHMCIVTQTTHHQPLTTCHTAHTKELISQNNSSYINEIIYLTMGSLMHWVSTTSLYMGESISAFPLHIN